MEEELAVARGEVKVQGQHMQHSHLAHHNLHTRVRAGVVVAGQLVQPLLLHSEQPHQALGIALERQSQGNQKKRHQVCSHQIGKNSGVTNIQFRITGTTKPESLYGRSLIEASYGLSLLSGQDALATAS